MNDAIAGTRKSRGRPKGDAISIHLRLPAEQVEQLDAWLEGEARHKGQDKPNSRAHAIREILRERFE